MRLEFPSTKDRVFSQGTIAFSRGVQDILAHAEVLDRTCPFPVQTAKSSRFCGRKWDPQIVPTGAEIGHERHGDSNGSTGAVRTRDRMYGKHQNAEHRVDEVI